jgi:hypothetical protein
MGCRANLSRVPMEIKGKSNFEDSVHDRDPVHEREKLLVTL